jgi:hypothetical protein
MIRRGVLWLGLVCVMIAVRVPSARSQGAPAQPPVSHWPTVPQRDEYAIFRLILRRLAQDSATVLVFDTALAEPYPPGSPAASWILRRDSSLVAPYRIANQISLPLAADSLEVGRHVALIRSSPRSQQQWDSLNVTYPHRTGIIAFSRVGLSQDGSRAVVNVGNDAYWGAGNCNLYFLVRDAFGTWTVAHVDEWLAS